MPQIIVKFMIWLAVSAVSSPSGLGELPIRRSVVTEHSGIPLFPGQAPTLALEVDNLYFLVTAVTAFFALLVVICVIVFAIKCRDRTGHRAGASMAGSIPLELAWSIVPFFTSMVIFGWATVVFFDRVRTPDQTLEIHSTATDGCGARSTSGTCRSDAPSR